MRLVVQGFSHGRGKKRTLEQLELIVIAILLLISLGTHQFSKEKSKSNITVKEILKENAEDTVLEFFFPALCVKDDILNKNMTEIVWDLLVSYHMPVYTRTENFKSIENVTYVPVEDRENDKETKKQKTPLRESYVIENVPEEMLALLDSENGFTGNEEAEFIKNENKIAAVNLNAYENIDDFIQAFYTVDAVTKAVPELFDVEVLSNMDMTIKQTPDKPQILIYHTHSQEAFWDSLPGDRDATIVGAGELLKEILTVEYGYNVIHHMGEYDVPSRDYAYSKSLPAIEQILSENPSIEVVIDLHRDGVAESTHLVTDINGVKTAKIMFFNGLCRTKKNGPIGYLKNDNLQENLAFSFQMQMAAREYYPGITRKNYLNAYRYNMHLRGKSLLVELGAQTNTVEEIKNAIVPLAHILDIVLSGGQ